MLFSGPVEGCSRPLGMEGEGISDNQLSATSVFENSENERWEAHLARLNREGPVTGWTPKSDEQKQYIEVSSKKCHASCCCFLLLCLLRWQALRSAFFTRKFKMQDSNSVWRMNWKDIFKAIAALLRSTRFLIWKKANTFEYNLLELWCFAKERESITKLFWWILFSYRHKWKQQSINRKEKHCFPELV